MALIKFLQEAADFLFYSKSYKAMQLKVACATSKYKLPFCLLTGLLLDSHLCTRTTQ